MIKGAIETASRELVSGWIYSGALDVSGQLIQAFIGKTCVGTGRVEFHRQDLEDAGLGEGVCGFHFPVKLKKADQPGSIVVRLERCDAVLLQTASRVVGD